MSKFDIGSLPSSEGLESFDAFLSEVTLARMEKGRASEDWFKAIAAARGEKGFSEVLSHVTKKDLPIATLGFLSGVGARSVGPMIVPLLASLPALAIGATSLGALLAIKLPKKYTSNAVGLDAERLSKRIIYAEQTFRRLESKCGGSKEKADLAVRRMRTLFQNLVEDRSWPGSP